VTEVDDRKGGAEASWMLYCEWELNAGLDVSRSAGHWTVHGRVRRRAHLLDAGRMF
jgi:hypothetical protein